MTEKKLAADRSAELQRRREESASKAKLLAAAAKQQSLDSQARKKLVEQSKAEAIAVKAKANEQLQQLAEAKEVARKEALAKAQESMGMSKAKVCFLSMLYAACNPCAACLSFLPCCPHCTSPA